ncbi:tetratricopeptide repeat protein [Legionella jordanis]|uniref:tetratricopeptide repeat protein n=1 Tax=Legionella jordanis TaxID=456 RepID=UPI002180738B|nr:tetratricopeptide repeat protein [Legionella jordanis]
MKAMALFILVTLSFPSHSFSWKNLWQTKDQQGQVLMAEGKFKEAQKTFQQQAWKAAAAYRAGNYKEAAEYYSAMQNAEGFYNEGNALAMSKQYEQAIKAYDKALALNPEHRDAEYNRKLIQDLLSQNQQDQNQQDQNQQGQNQQGQNQQGQNQQGQNQQGQNQQGQNQQGQNQQGQNQQGQNQQGQNQQGQNQQGQNQQGQNQQDQNQQDQNQQGQNQQGQNQQGQNQQGQNQKNTKQNQEEKQVNQHGQAAGVSAESADEVQQQQSKEQWLKLIPDDPGGLLREKFLRDHMRRQRGWYQ